MTVDEAMSRSDAAQAQFWASFPPAWGVLVRAFLELLEAETQATLEAGESDPSAYIGRPLSNAWNAIGVMLINCRLSGLAEQLFRESLKRELELESQYQIRFHKGYSYHNLGLAQVGQGNWNEGIQNIRRAVQEDIDSGVTMENSHAHRVTRSMVVAPERDALKGSLTPVLGANGYPPDPHVLDGLFEGLTLEMSLQAAFSIKTARTTSGDTEFGRTLRLNALRDACHILEVWLRNHGHVGRGLKPCLDSAYGDTGGAWWPRLCNLWQSGHLTSANCTADAEARIDDIETAVPALTPDHLLVRNHLFAGLLRNWTHHQFDPNARFLGDPDYQCLYCSPWICLWHAQSQSV